MILKNSVVLLSKKRNKDEDKKEKEKKKPVILMFTCKEPNNSNWRDVCNAFKNENSELNICYMRYKDKLGHIAVIPDNDDELKFKDKFEYDKTEFTVQKCENDDLNNFYKEHEDHFKMCVEMNERKNKKGGKKGKKGKDESKEKEKKNKKPKLDFNKTELKNEVTLGEQKFKDASLIKAETRKIINETKENEKLSDKNQKFILDLLKYHHNYEEKTKDLDYITVGKPENYDSSRCFIIVDKKNNKKDFSALKCIENLVKKINKK